jgi:3-dehydroquinate dehydratase type II
MKKIILIHGPNLNLLGKRDAKHYGNFTLAMLENIVKKEAKKLGISVISFQSNYEGALIDFLQKHRKADGVIINPGALSHYSFALHDALLDTNLPAVEVHLSNISKREKWRTVSVTAPACKKVISGKKIQGYLEALYCLNKYCEL